jgi:hypothetical protein
MRGQAFKIQDHEKNTFGGVSAQHLYIVCLQEEQGWEKSVSVRIP